jgi:uncharacterized protein
MKHLILSFVILTYITVLNGQYSEEILNYRLGKKRDFLQGERRSPLKTQEDVDKMRYYNIDQSYKCDCQFKISPEEKPFDLPTYSGVTRKYIKYGEATCKLQKEIITLTLYQNLSINNPIYKNHLFLPIKDLTSGNETYGGGRYIDLNKMDIDANGNLVIDFNKLYNPWCAYSDGFSCPIPPKENQLKIEIKAGELNYNSIKLDSKH